jgi:hypothetical protein
MAPRTLRGWTSLVAITTAALTVAGAPAHAQDTPAPDGPSAAELGSLIVGLEVGAMLPFSALGPHMALGLELGWVLPFAERRMDVFAAAGYSPPSRSFVTGDEYEGELTQQELFLSLGPRLRLFELGRTLNASLALGPRMYLLRSTSTGGRRGNAFAEFEEESTRFGFFVAAGGEWVLGPGAVLLDVDFGWSKLPHRITGDVSTAGLALTLGYRLFVL